MKYLLGLLGVVSSTFIAIYVLVFTVFGNGLIKPTIESKIQEQTKLNSTLSTFSLSMSEFEIVLELSENNKINLKGEYSLFSQSFNVTYTVEIQNLEELKSLKLIADYVSSDEQKSEFEAILQKHLDGEQVMGEFKSLLVDVMGEFLKDFQKRKDSISDEYVLEVLERGREKAQSNAREVLSEVEKAMGMRFV